MKETKDMATKVGARQQQQNASEKQTVLVERVDELDDKERIAVGFCEHKLC